MTNPAQLPSSSPCADDSVERFRPLLLAAALFLLVYGVELGNFGLSIDEEIATFITGKEMEWLKQGRWGMSLLTLLLPNFEAMPLLSTVLFGAGLIFATWRAIGDFGLSRSQAYLFAAVHTGFPLWLHVAQFNTLAGGFGFGIAAAALGSGLAVRQGRSAALPGLALIAFAASVYQTLALYCLLYIFLALQALPGAADASRRKRIQSLLALTVRALAIWLAGIAAYWVVQRVSQTAFHAPSTYVGGYLQFDRLISNPTGSLAMIAKFIRSLLLGNHPLYLSWGAAVLFLSWSGMLPWRLLDRDRGGVHNKLADWGGVLALAMVGMVLVTLPVFLSVASLPARAYVTWPLLAAWMASRIAPSVGISRFPRLQWLAIGYFSITVVSIGASLFYADRVVHEADSALTQRLLPEMQRVRPEAGTGECEFTIAGTFSYPLRGQIQSAELFGTSFYEHDGGNVYRVFFYMQLRGMTGFRPVPLGKRPDLLPALRSMPNWPAPGSVGLVNGVVVIKFGEPSSQQMPGT